MIRNHPAIVLSSGGLDSTTCLAIARAEAFSPIYSMSFDYGQRHRHELRAAAQIAGAMGVKEHRVITIDLRQFGGSALTADIAVPKDQIELSDGATKRRSDGGENVEERLSTSSSFSSSAPSSLRRSVAPSLIPITYVPARNTIFLSYALAWAEVLDCDDVFIGVNALDYSGYPDCRPEFVDAFQAAARLGTRRSNFTIHAPLVHLTKAQIIRRGMDLDVDYGMTHSCYDPDEQGRACGHCDSCLLRRKGFAEAGVTDPTQYVA